MRVFDASTLFGPTADGALGRGRELQRMRPADLYDAWLFAETDAALALDAWRSAGPEDRPDAYAVYVAALEREGQAAMLLERRLQGAR